MKDRNGSSWQLITLSASEPAALLALADRLGTLAADQPQLSLRQLAGSLAARPELPHRMAVAASSAAELAESLLGGDERKRMVGTARPDPALVYLYPGVGDHYPSMAADLYHSAPVFRDALDLCCELAGAELGTDPHDVLDLAGSTLPAAGPARAWPDLAAMMRLTDRPVLFDEPRMAQVLVFAVEYALTEVLRDWGLHPSALLGYSIGEYTAACVAGVLTLSDAMRLVARRAMLIEGTAEGAMVAILLGADEVTTWLAKVGDPGLAVAAIDGPKLCVVSGPAEAVTELERMLSAEGIATRKLPVRHAFHSPVLTAIEQPLADLAAGFPLREPRIPLVSNVTGTWLTAALASSPDYWARHMSHTVQLYDGLAEVLALPGAALLEVGPGQTLGTLAHQHSARSPESVVIPTLPGPFHGGSGIPYLLSGIGRAWVHGLPVDLRRVTAHE